MKNLYIIGGTMGVGKTTVSQIMKMKLCNSVFLDGDWCWDSNPFRVNEETKEMVMENICFLLNQFISCPAYQNIIFCWVLHEQSIIDDILSRINTNNCQIKNISLICGEAELTDRIMSDVSSGKRTVDVLKRSLSRLSNYSSLNTTKIVTDGKLPEQIAAEIIDLT